MLATATTIRIEFIRGWNNYRDGQRVDFPQGMAELLIRRGLARPVTTAAATAPAKVERLDQPDTGKRGPFSRKRC